MMSKIDCLERAARQFRAAYQETQDPEQQRWIRSLLRWVLLELVRVV